MKKSLLTIALMLVVGLSWANHWVVNNSQFSNYMTVTCVVQINGEEQYSTQLELGSFSGNEVRGSVYAKKTPTNRYFFMLPCWGESGDEFHFRLYDAEHDVELDNYVCSSVLVYNQNGYGGLSSPYVLNFEGGPSDFHFTTAGNWSDASNWGGTMPDATSSVVIDANCALNQDATVASLSITDGAVLTLQSGNTLTVTGDLTNSTTTGLIIKDGAQLVNASANVSATVEKDIIAYGSGNPDGWYTIASPVDNMVINGSDFLTPEYDLYRFNDGNVGHEWENYKAGHADFTNFENGRGYLYSNTNTFTPVFSGTLNYATVTYPLSCAAAASDLKGINLIGNPFPHAIYKGKGGAIDDANLASGYYTLTNEGAWQVHVFDEAIMPGQGILVKSVAAGNLVISKSNVAATSESISLKEEMRRMRISVVGSTGADQSYVYFGQGIGLGKMNNFSNTAPSLSVHYEGHRFAITHVGEEVESLDVFFKNTQHSDFTLAVEAKGVRFGYLHLIDNVTGANIDLLQQPEYTFSATGNEYEARFKLEFQIMTGIEEWVDKVFCFVQGEQLIVVSDTKPIKLTLTDVLGRVVKTMTLEGDRCGLSGFESGLYIVRMSDGNRFGVQKIVINH